MLVVRHCDGLVEMIKMDISFDYFGDRTRKVLERQNNRDVDISMTSTPPDHHTTATQGDRVAAHHWPSRRAGVTRGRARTVPRQATRHCAVGRRRTQAREAPRAQRQPGRMTCLASISCRPLAASLRTRERVRVVRSGRVAHCGWPVGGRLHGPPVACGFFLFLLWFSVPGSGSGPVRHPRAQFSPGFLLHRLRHLPLHATVPWGGRLHPRKEGEVLHSPKSPPLQIEAPFPTSRHEEEKQRSRQSPTKISVRIRWRVEVRVREKPELSASSLPLVLRRMRLHFE
jgi:hypothetical protein